MNAIQTRGIVAVGVDDSPEALTAARYAVILASARHVDLLVVHAYQFPLAMPEMTVDLMTATHAEAEQVALSVVSQLTLPTTMRVGTVVEVASPAALLCRVAESAAVLVVGVHHFDLSDQLLTGPVASAVAATADCPVIVVPRQWTSPNRPGSIVATLDGETPAMAVLDFTFDEAERSQSSVAALHAVPRSTRPGSGVGRRASISEILAGHQQHHPDIVVRTLVVPGEPTSVIIDESLVGTMVVVGRPHRRRLGSWTRSVARAVLDRAQCPLVVVPTHHTRTAPPAEPLLTVMAAGT
jgi:nucleotide-binding universal stress UspA family protein